MYHYTEDRCIGVFYFPSICLEQKRRVFIYVHIYISIYWYMYINYTTHIIHFSFKLYFPVLVVHLANNVFHGPRKLSLCNAAFMGSGHNSIFDWLFPNCENKFCKNVMLWRWKWYYNNYSISVITDSVWKCIIVSSVK